MPRTSTVPLISSVNLYLSETTPSTNVGAFYLTDDGRGFRYSLVGATALVAGSNYQGVATDTNFNELAVPATAVGATVITVTLAGTAVTADQFKDGVATVSTSTGIGQTFRILGHTVQTSTTGTVDLTIDEPIVTALTTSSKVTIRPNPWRNVVVAAAAVTCAVVGNAINLAAATKYAWLQTKGIGAALSDATVTAAATMGLSPSAGTAGAVTKHVNQDQYLGRSLAPVMVSAKVYPVIWQLD